MHYFSTRNKTITATPSQAILDGIASDGGLFIPSEMPHINLDEAFLTQSTYQQMARVILQAFLPDFTVEEIDFCVRSAYETNKFDCEELVALKKFDNDYFLELFHGETIAFKDMALSILPYLMVTAAKKNNDTKQRLILTATSGDTGKAAMAGFANVPNTKIIVFYPKNGVSHVQELQMLSQKGDNTHVVGITGNFDDAQSAVKTIFTDATMIDAVHQLGYAFSSANSINIGRLIPQVVYYVYAYAQLVKQNNIAFGDAVHICVPTGNFGNILAAYYAKQLGLPIQLLICASNKNNVLSDFLQSGTYNKNRPFHVTNSPSMDILISSNLERLLAHATNENDSQLAHYMHQLSTDGYYTLDDDAMTVMDQFIGDFASEEMIEQHIFEFYTQHHYLMDPHTAVASVVTQRYRQLTNDDTPVIIAATASPYKFPRPVLAKFDVNTDEKDDLALLDTIRTLSNVPYPKAVIELQEATIRHNRVIAIDDINETVLTILKGN